MARGNNKPQSALSAQAFPEPLKPGFKFGLNSDLDFVSAPKLWRTDKNLIDAPIIAEADKDAFAKFFNKIKDYQVGSRENRYYVVEAFKALPEYIQKVVTDPSSDLDKLFRGSKRLAMTPDIDDDSKEYGVASFTPDFLKARSFSKNVMSSRDIESIKGIINTDKVAILAARNFDAITDSRYNYRWTHSFGERERIVWGIKYKSGVGIDHPKWLFENAEWTAKEEQKYEPPEQPGPTN